MSGPWDRPSPDPGAEWPSEDLDSPRTPEPRETEGDAWASGDLWPESPRDAESAWGDWPSPAPPSDEYVLDETPPALSDPWGESWGDESSDPLASPADAWSPTVAEPSDEPAPFEPVPPRWDEPAVGEPPSPESGEPTDEAPSWLRPEGVTPEASTDLDAPTVDAQAPEEPELPRAEPEPAPAPPAPSSVEPWAVDTDPWGAAVPAEEVRAEAPAVEPSSPPEPSPLPDWLAEPTPEPAAAIEAEPQAETPLEPETVPALEAEPEPAAAPEAAAEPDATVEAGAEEPEHEADGEAEPTAEPDGGASWRRFVPWAASAGAAADAPETGPDIVPSAEPEGALEAEPEAGPVGADGTEGVAAETPKEPAPDVDETESAWRRFAPWAGAAVAATDATPSAPDMEPEVEPEPETTRATTQPVPEPEVEAEPEPAAALTEPEPAAAEVEPEPEPEPVPEPEPEPAAAEVEPEPVPEPEPEPAAAEVEPEPGPVPDELVPEPEPAAAGAEPEPEPLAPWAVAASPWAAPESGEEPPGAAQRMPDWLITDDEPAEPVGSGVDVAAPAADVTEAPPQESTQVLPTSWTPPPPPSDSVQPSGALEPSGGDIRTRLGTPGPDLDEDVEPEATTAEQAVPWLIGFILLLAGMVIVLLALIFAGDQSLGAGLLGASGSPGPSESGVASPSAPVAPSPTPQPSASGAPSATPVPAPQYGPLEMLYQGRAAALAPIYLLRHDFTTEDEPVTLAQDRSLDVRRFAWAPDGTIGAGLLADVLVSIEEGQEKRRLGDGIVTITFGDDASTIYAVRVTEDGANDVATVMAIDFVSGDTSELATINYPRPDIAAENALADAQFEDDGGAVRLYWMEDGALRLWALDAGTWEISTADGEVTDLEEALPVLWAPDLVRRITVEEAEGTSTITLLGEDGEPAAATSVEGLVSHLRWSPSGDRVAFTVGRSGSGDGVLQNLWLWDLGDDEAPMQLTATGAAFGVEWRGTSATWRD